MPKISLVMTAYNREHYLAEAIDSVLAQTWTDFDLLIWDDGSHDQSLHIARDYAHRDRRVKVVSASHQGNSAALKAAIAQTTGNYIGSVDSDDLLAPTALAETLAILQENPRVGFVYTDYLDIDQSGKLKVYGKRCSIPYSKERLLLDFMTFHFRLIRRSVYDQVGGIDPEVLYCEDYDLCLKLSEVAEVRHLKKPLYYYRQHSANISHQYRRQQAENSVKAIAKALERRGLTNKFQVSLEILNYLPFKSQIKLALKKASNFLFAILPLAGAISFQPVYAQINPATDGTNTIVTPQGNQLNISGGTLSNDGANLFQSFSKFNVNSNQTANFLANPTIQNILGRVTGGEASIINGLIQVTGGNSNLFLMNPAGIIFGQNAQLNIPAAFTATTATGIGFNSGWFNAIGVNNYATLIGTPNTFNFSTSQPGSIINAGNLTVGQGQNLNLLGGTIVSTGQLSAPSGQIIVSAVPGSSLVRISQPGHLLSLEIDASNNSQGLYFTPLSLPQLLTGAGVNSATGLSVNNTGELILTSGNISAPSESGTNLIFANLNVSNNVEGSKGGTIALLGNKVGLLGNATINASGNAGGGTVLIGGDYQGKGNVPNAAFTFVGSDVNINADAINNGNGGKIILWSDQATRIYGTITAKGGNFSGNGGFIETSSKGYLDILKAADASAINGLPGTWLIDPRNVTITTNNTIGGGFSNSNPNIFTPTGDDAIVNVRTINSSLSSGTDVTITTGSTGSQAGNITLDSGANIGGGYGGTTVTLTLAAANNILLNGSITGNIFGLNVLLEGATGVNSRANDITITQPISTGGGYFKSTSNTFSIAGTTITTNGGNITINALNSIAVNGLNTRSIGDGGEINLTTSLGKNITIGGNINSVGVEGVSGNITLTGDSLLNNNTINFNGGNITFNGLLNGTGTGGQSLIVNATGNLTFNNSVGNSIPIGNLSVITANNVIINGNITTNSNSIIDISNAVTKVNINGDVALTADEINFASPVIGTGNLTLQPATSSRNIEIGNTNNTSGVLSLTTTDIVALQSGFNSITIGGANSSGLVTLLGNTTFLSPLTIQSPQGTGAINTAGFTLTNSSGRINLLGNQNITTGNITAQSGISITSNNGNINTVAGILNSSTSTNSNGGAIALIGKGINTGIINSSTATASNTNNAGAITLNSGINNITINGDINASGNGGIGGNISFTGNTILALGNTTFTTSGNAGSGNITFNNSLNGLTTGNQNLTLNAGAGNISFIGEVGNSIALGNLSANSTGVTSFNKVNAGNLITNLGGTTQINGNINTTGAQTYNDVVRIANNPTLTGVGISFGNTVDGNSNLTANAGTGNITFTGAIGNTTPLGNLIANSTGTILFNTVNAGSLTTNGGTTQINGNINTTGNQTYNNPVTIANNPTLTAVGISFGNTLDGNSNFIANAGTGNLSFTGVVGSISPLLNMDVNAANIFINNNVTNQGNFTANVSGNGNFSLLGAALTQGGNFNVISAGKINISGGITTNGGNINLKGSIIEGSGNLNSSSSSQNGGNITIKARDQITTGIINSSSSIANGGNVTLDPIGDIQVSAINAQGGSRGNGGNVDITTDKFFRATDTFIDQNNHNSSISTAGGIDGGSIIIRHGGMGLTPFIVGNATTNGTAGVLTTGLTNINSGSFLFTENRGKSPNTIGIISVPEPSPPPQQHPLPPLPTNSANSGNTITQGINQIEEQYTNKFEEYIGKGEADIPIKSPKEAQNILNNIQQETGVKPALIYVSFVPQLLSYSELSKQNLKDLTEHDNDQLELVIVTAKGDPIRKRIEGTTRKEVLKLAQEFRNGVINIRRPRAYEAPARQFYQWLITPLETDLQTRGINNLVFLMDSGLRSIPIAALYDGQKFVVEKYSVGLMPSLSLTDTRYKNIKDAQVLAMGASKFANQNPLPAVAAEVSNITKGLWIGKSFLNEDFTLANLKAQRQQEPFGIIHLATHGEFKAGQSSNSYIQLWDSKLQLNQLRDLGWNNPPVELVVLSACRTALGDENAELGFAGFAVLAGVKTALASLWYVSDEGTLGLMTEFYQQLKKAPIKAEGLRQAQIAMLKGEARIEYGKLHTQNGDFSLPLELEKLGYKELKHPYYWAAFTMIGNPW